MKNTVDKFLNDVFEQAMNKGLAKNAKINSTRTTKTNSVLQKELILLYGHLQSLSKIKQKLNDILNDGRHFKSRRLSDMDKYKLLYNHFNSVVFQKQNSEAKKANLQYQKYIKETELSERLLKFGMKEHILNLGYSIEQSRRIFILLLRNKVPFNIALLHLIGFFERYSIGNLTIRDKELGELFSVNPRRIRGNVHVLSRRRPAENIHLYTAHLHVEKVKEILREQEMYNMHRKF